MEKTGLKLIDQDDQTLAKLACGGCQGAYLVLYDRYKAGLALHVSQYVSRREEIEDIVLESFQKAFSQIAGYNTEFRFSTWLYTIARNTALDHIDKNGRRNTNLPTNSIDDEAAGLDAIVATFGDPEATIILSQEYDKTVEAINGLPEIYREVASMVLLENFGYQEVSDKTGLPLGTVKTRLKRAKEYILKKLSCQEDQ